MARSWLIDSKGIATKVKNASLPSAVQLKDCGANRKCPNCHYVIDNSDVSQEWPGFPAGVKFDPSDIELLEHLAAKCGVGNSEPHKFIDEFIPTVEKDGGICYAHPEDLPGAKRDGSSTHFFHRIKNAYASGQRKRRRIQKDENSSNREDVRWHKTGKTKSVMENGVHMGWKKIMVLYRVVKKGSKPDKANWVMHQYHLGTNGDEPEGQFVVSKIFYQQNKLYEHNATCQVMEGSDLNAVQSSPRTPRIAPNPPRQGVSTPYEDVLDVYVHQPLQQPNLKQEAEFVSETPRPPSSVPQFNDDVETQTWLAGESQAIDDNGFGDSLLCNEIFNSYHGVDNNGLGGGSLDGCGRFTTDTAGSSKHVNSGNFDLTNLELDTPPDFQFDSQDSIFSWLDRL